MNLFEFLKLLSNFLMSILFLIYFIMQLKKMPKSVRQKLKQLSFKNVKELATFIDVVNSTTDMTLLQNYTTQIFESKLIEESIKTELLLIIANRMKFLGERNGNE